MAAERDAAEVYALSLGFQIAPKTVLVEGTSDAALFRLAAQLEHQETGNQLLGPDLAIAAAGFANRGGTPGVVRELISLRAVARTCLLPNGRPQYRIVGLFDNDKAGREAVKTVRALDSSVLEYKDVFRLFPVMPLSTNFDPVAMQKSFERENGIFKGLDWEIEDLYAEALIDAFSCNFAGGVIKVIDTNGKTHREFTPEGKARLHQFAKLNAKQGDLLAVIDVLKALRCYLGLR